MRSRQSRQPVKHEKALDVQTSSLRVVDLARPGVGRRGDSRGGVASDIASNARVGLLKSAVVGRHLDGSRPVAEHARW